MKDLDEIFYISWLEFRLLLKRLAKAFAMQDPLGKQQSSLSLLIDSPESWNALEKLISWGWDGLIMLLIGGLMLLFSLVLAIGVISDCPEWLLESLASSKIVPVKFAPVKFALFKIDPDKSASVKFALFKIDPDKSASVKFAPSKMDPVEFAPFKSAPDKTALVKSAPFKSASF